MQANLSTSCATKVSPRGGHAEVVWLYVVNYYDRGEKESERERERGARKKEPLSRAREQDGVMETGVEERDGDEPQRSKATSLVGSPLFHPFVAAAAVAALPSLSRARAALSRSRRLLPSPIQMAKVNFAITKYLAGRGSYPPWSGRKRERPF